MHLATQLWILVLLPQSGARGQIPLHLTSSSYLTSPVQCGNKLTCVLQLARVFLQNWQLEGSMFWLNVGSKKGFQQTRHRSFVYSKDLVPLLKDPLFFDDWAAANFKAINLPPDWLAVYQSLIKF